MRGQALQSRERGYDEVSVYVQLSTVDAKSELTWPIPPEAPATTEYNVNTSSSVVSLSTSYQL